MTEQRVEILGIRHHGPGSARSVAAALAELQPDLVLIEGPPELDALVPLAGDPDLVPPVAALVYAVNEPRRAAYYPFAAFSPEWVALQWALAHGVEVHFADLPATHFLALERPPSDRNEGTSATDPVGDSDSDRGAAEPESAPDPGLTPDTPADRESEAAEESTGGESGGGESAVEGSGGGDSAGERREADAPPHAADAPPHAVDAAPQAADAPPHAVDPPPHPADAPRHAADAAPHAADAAPEAADAPPHAADAPPHAADAPPHAADAPRHAAPDVIGELAGTAGYDDPERWWEDAVEHRHDSSLADFAAIREAVGLVRSSTAWEDEELIRREAAMRKALRTARRQGRQRIAFVCGAFHAPALDPAGFPSAASDNALLRGLPKIKVTATWAPWTSSRLARRTGYGAGVDAPGWYQHLFTTWATDPTLVGASWMVRVARALRDEQLVAPPASVVDATRLADALAVVRGRPSVGLAELTDATQSVLADGSDLPLRLVHEALVVGHDLGQVPEHTPMVPLAADLARAQRSLRLKPAATSTTLVLDLRRESQLARSVLFHRLGLLGIPWAVEVEAGRTTGTFKEAWELAWEPEYAVALIEASGYGTTLIGAAEEKVREQSAEASLDRLAALLESCLLADLPAALRDVVAAVADRTARQHDVPALLLALGPLARTLRYGDVRGVDLEGLAHVVETIVVRASVGLRAACASLDDDAAAHVREAIEVGDRAIGLLDEDALRAPWREALGKVGADSNVHGSVAGRANRLLLDAGVVAHEEAARRLSRQLSLATPADQAAAWLDGFLSGDATLLLHEHGLLALIDEWVSGITEETFEDLLPLLRRTFARFVFGERRALGRAVRNLGGEAAATEGTSEIALARARPAMLRVADLLGLEVMA